MFASLLLTLLTSSVFAAPSLKTSGCSLSDATLPQVPTGLAAPATSNPSFVGLAFGVQNYTCSSAGTYTSVGAFAEVFDASCLADRPTALDELTDSAIGAWNAAPADLTELEVVNYLAGLESPLVLGQHYFIPNPITGVGLSAKWDFTSASEKGHSNAFVVGAKTGNVPAPTNPTTNVDWLSLSNVQGDLAAQVFRIQTRGGQPPTSCVVGSALISVRYVSQYWFFGGSF